MFDCVQFPRRGWVHRNRFQLSATRSDWLTLPIVKCARDTRIADLRFAPDARARLEAAMKRFPVFAERGAERDAFVDRVLAIETDDVARYLCELVAHITAVLGISKPTLRSSELRIDPELRGQDRVIAIARHLNAVTYINPSGGRELYDPATFSAHGIDLRFLKSYAGSMDSILSRLLRERAVDVAAEIARESTLER